MIFHSKLQCIFVNLGYANKDNNSLKFINKNTKSYIELLPITWLILILQNILFGVHLVKNSFDLAFLGIFFTTNILLVLIVQFFNALSFNFNILKSLINITLFSIYIILIGYHAFVGTSLDFLLAMENLENFKYGETLEMAVDLNWLFAIRITLVIVILYILNKLFGFFSQSISTNNLKKLLSSGLLISLILVSPFQHNEELISIANSAISYSYRGQFKKYELPDGTAKFPYLNVNKLTSDIKNETAPNVFLIILESCNSSFLESKNEMGLEYMPFMNSLIKKGVYVENFYSNSIFTGKGHFSILTGVFPSIGNSVFSHYPNLNTQSLPEILNEAGYRSTFFHGYHDLRYGGALPYYKSMNFDLIKQMDEEFITPEDKPYIWGWGLQDDKFFIKYFNYLDRDIQVNRSENGTQKPYFSVLGTMSHHFDFKSYPKDQAFIYPDPQSEREYFANSIYLEDLYLRTFFEELEKREYLKDNIVILVGDHGFPSEGIGIQYNGNLIYSGYNENRFRTPLLILHEGKLKPQRIKDAFSQIDIGPTVLDMLNLKALNSFTGKSIFEPNQIKNTVHLVQPYDGLYLASIRYPYKYIYQEHTGNEFLFKLNIDPKESNNLIMKMSQEEGVLVEELRRETEKIYFNQKLIEQNRIWLE